MPILGIYTSKFVNLECIQEVDISFALGKVGVQPNSKSTAYGWGEPSRTLVSWRQGFGHPTRNKFMGWFAQIMAYRLNHMIY